MLLVKLIGEIVQRCENVAKLNVIARLISATGVVVIVTHIVIIIIVVIVVIVVVLVSLHALRVGY